MSLAVNESGPGGRNALPRGAGLAVLAAALGLHVALVAAVFWSPPRAGTVAEGQGGLRVGLGPSGAAPGAVATAPPRPAETVPPPAASPVQEAATNAAAVTDAPAPTQPTPVDESVAPQVARSVDVPPVRQPEAAMAAPTTPETDLATDAVPETVTAATPRDGLGVSRRPEERPAAVEEAGRAATAARREAPVEVEAEAPVPSRSTASGQQGQGGSSQGATRGAGDGTEGGGSAGARADFAALVAARLARSKQYPGAAQARGMQGTGVVRFSIDSGGRVTAARLDRSTGHALLDAAIMRTLRRASLPAIPATLGLSRMEFSVPIAFSLR